MSSSGVWTRRSALYDLLEGSDLRRGPFKRRLFNRVSGRTLLIAVGTGLDLRHFPPGRVTAIDFSPAMLDRARLRAKISPSYVQLLAADAQCLPFAAATFDTVITSCTLCSVPNPDLALAEIRRVLAPSGTLHLFEHVRSRDLLLALALDVMTLWSRRSGTDMNRRTLQSVVRAGFTICRLEPVFLDIILAIDARPHEHWQPPGFVSPVEAPGGRHADHRAPPEIQRRSPRADDDRLDGDRMG